MIRTRRTLALTLLAFMCSTVAFGYWTAPGSGTVTGTLLNFSAPAVTVTNPIPGTAHLTWTAARVLPAGSGPDGEVTYVVDRRRAGNSTWVRVCQTDVAPLASTELSCDNNNVGASATYDYRVTARFRSWTSQGTATAAIVADTFAPAVTLTSPASGTFQTTATPTLSGAAGTAPGDSSTVTVTICPGAAQGTCGSPRTLTATVSGGTWSATLGSALGDGAWTAVAHQSDTAGNTGDSAAVSFVVDTQDPAVSMTAPAGGAHVRQTLTLTASASDPLKNGVASGLSTVRFQRSPAGAGTWTDIGSAMTAGPFTMTVDTTALADGQYDFRAVATDAAGNVTRAARVTVGVDNTAPTGSITAPSNNAYAGNSLGITSNSADAGSGVASVQFQRAAAGTPPTGAWTNVGPADTGAPFSTTLNTAALPEAAYDLRVVTTDLAGNTFTSGTVRFRTDHRAPTAAMTAPAANAILRGTTNALTATATDPTSAGISSGVASVLFQRSPAGANTWTDIGTADTSSPYGVNFDTTGLANGSYDLRAVSTDNAGNVTSSPSVRVTVATPIVTAVSLANNGTAGTPDNFDLVRVTFSESVDVASICRAMTPDNLWSSSTLTVTITDAGANDVLTVSSSACTFNFGSLSLGGDYVSATTDFGGTSGFSVSRARYTSSNFQLSIYLGQMKPGGAVNAAVTPGQPTYAPSPGIHTSSGGLSFAAPAGPLGVSGF